MLSENKASTFLISHNALLADSLDHKVYGLLMSVYIQQFIVTIRVHIRSIT